MDQIQQVLSVNPRLESKARIKRLHEDVPAGYRLRVGDYRVFYDVEANDVTILAILSKEEAGPYLEGN